MSIPMGTTTFVPAVAPKLVPAFTPTHEPFQPLPFVVVLSSASFGVIVSTPLTLVDLDLTVECELLNGLADAVFNETVPKSKTSQAKRA